MKKLLIIASLAILSTAASASVLKVCAVQANEVCKELTDREEFNQCHRMVMDTCMDSVYKTGQKSNPQCVQECLMTSEEAHLDMCLATCSPL